MGSRSGHENLAYEFREVQATTMCISSRGDYGLLAGRKCLVVVALEKGKIVTRSNYGGKFDISRAQWSSIIPNYAAIACSQKCDIYFLKEDGILKCLHKLKGHTRVITDLDWCRQETNLLATSSFDNHVHIWDIRAPSCSGTPAQSQLYIDKTHSSLSALDGASQVKWNPWNKDILATCDGGHVKIWDLRKTKGVYEYISAHASKINGLSWAEEKMIITAAQDGTAKYSYLGSPKTKGPTISLNNPVWRARVTPFGKGLVTQCSPILKRESSGTLSLWQFSQFNQPAYIFQSNDVLEFGWRKGQISFDLVTWSRDQVLRIWTLPSDIIEKFQEAISDDYITQHSDKATPGAGGQPSDVLEIGKVTLENKNEVSDSHISGVRDEQHKFEQLVDSSYDGSELDSSLIEDRDDILRREIQELNSHPPECISCDSFEVEKSLLRITWLNSVSRSKATIKATIHISFPMNYPSSIPKFLVTNASTEVDKSALHKILRQSSQTCARSKSPCLKYCVLQFAEFMKPIKPVSTSDDTFSYSSRASNVPFPRTSGARFCSVGILVCFGRPSYLKRVKSNRDTGTPRSLSALGPFISQVAPSYEDVRGRRNSRRDSRKKAGFVTVFDLSCLLPFQRDLAEHYKNVCSNPISRKEVCMANTSTANLLAQDHDVKLAWQAASILSHYFCQHEAMLLESIKRLDGEDALVATERRNNFDTVAASLDALSFYDNDDDEEDMDWINHYPLGKPLLHEMIKHFGSIGDIQTSSVLASVFSKGWSAKSRPQGSSLRPEGGVKRSVAVGKLRPRESGSLKRTKANTSGSRGSSYHTVHGTDTVLVPLTETYYRQQRSSSWSESMDEMKVLSLIEGSKNNGGSNSSENQPTTSNTNSLFQYLGTGAAYVKDRFLHNSSSGTSLISPTSSSNKSILHTVSASSLISIPDKFSKTAMVPRAPMTIEVEHPSVVFDNSHLYSLSDEYSDYKMKYAEVLYRWLLLNKRAEILKDVDSSKLDVNRFIVDSYSYCIHFKASGEKCHLCSRTPTRCSICNMPVKGLCMSCHICLHGGHPNHLLKWFDKEKKCPTGCGCSCTLSGLT